MPDDQPLSEVVIPPPQLSTPAVDKSDTSPRGPWEQVKSWGKIAVAIFAGVPSAVIATWVLVSLLVLTFHRHSIDLDAIGVPETLSKAGFTSEVATQHLRDAIYAIQEGATTTMAKTGIDTDQDLSGITIPKTGLSLQSVAVAVRSLLPGWRHEVSGEFVQLEKGLLLRLRLNGRLIFSKRAANDDPDWADALLGKANLAAADEALDKNDRQSGAFRVVEETQPYLAVSAIYGGGKSDELDAADKAADRIIAFFGAEAENVPPAFYLNDVQPEAFFVSALYIAGMNGDLTAIDEESDHDHFISFVRGEDENVIRAANLKGLISLAHHDDKQAEAFFKKLPRLAVAHSNLGLIYKKQNKLKKAKQEYQVAIWLDPNTSMAHVGLGEIYNFEQKPEMAIAEYQKAIELNPKFRLTYDLIGDVYNYYQHKPEMAIAEYQTAIQLDPKDASAHFSLGNVYYYNQNNPGMAIEEYQKAIELEWKLDVSYYSLGLALRDTASSSDGDAEKAKRLEDACRAFAEGSKLASDGLDFPARMHEIDSLMHGHGHCAPT
jgi:tetratricopeptide (TPR) repeat protein